RVNAAMVGKCVNIASRCAKLLDVHFGNAVWSPADAAGVPQDALAQREALLAEVHAATFATAAAHYGAGDFASVVRNAMAAADLVNEYIARNAPWTLARDPERHAGLHVVLGTALQGFADIAAVLKPVLPATIAQAERYLGVELGLLRRVDLAGRTLAGSYAPLFTRIDPK